MKMNKQELIKKYEGEFSSIGMNLSTAIKFKELWIDILELDETQEVEIPMFVADFITEQKKLGHTLSYSIDACMSDIVAEWYWDNSELFARAWLDGYTVEEEKRYRVKPKGVCFNSCLIFEKINKTWLFSSIYETDHQRENHTRKELEEAGFGWMFDCPLVEVEEVTE